MLMCKCDCIWGIYKVLVWGKLLVVGTYLGICCMGTIVGDYLEQDCYASTGLVGELSNNIGIKRD